MHICKCMVDLYNYVNKTFIHQQAWKSGATPTSYLSRKDLFTSISHMQNNTIECTIRCYSRKCEGCLFILAIFSKCDNTSSTTKHLHFSVRSPFTIASQSKCYFNDHVHCATSTCIKKYYTIHVC